MFVHERTTNTYRMVKKLKKERKRKRKCYRGTLLEFLTTQHNKGIILCGAMCKCATKNYANVI